MKMTMEEADVKPLPNTAAAATEQKSNPARALLCVTPEARCTPCQRRTAMVCGFLPIMALVVFLVLNRGSWNSEDGSKQGEETRMAVLANAGAGTEEATLQPTEVEGPDMSSGHSAEVLRFTASATVNNEAAFRADPEVAHALQATFAGYLTLPLASLTISYGEATRRLQEEGGAFLRRLPTKSVVPIDVAVAAPSGSDAAETVTLAEAADKILKLSAAELTGLLSTEFSSGLADTYGLVIQGISKPIVATSSASEQVSNLEPEDTQISMPFAADRDGSKSP
mmetsp:Transcript_58138/g.138348  ORF Transcript_58138/g.138348 Transcript_58138/m.138348 type:complete len:282 (-) Transcript_58138:180-1025(-)|eukprot:CAMPEP_0178428428 /NCGR_PEP_ID=MMETSP0689_2-20121128/30273_1 /TAXON_ID=160604 /ORGANISM="Amphidinium massartii, Strain CS-259" /LENGTH=281 /DNA_ID=CAMNT_0020050201 /DNA_START=32 /DNA_END=877 /DNA_ORIENTATION=-